MSEPFVDVVVRGQGEVTLVEVAEALLAKRSLEGSPACPGRATVSAGTTRTATWSRSMRFLIPAFDLTDFDAYEKLSGGQEDWHTPPASDARTRATTAPTWSFTSADSMPSRPSAWSQSSPTW